MIPNRLPVGVRVAGGRHHLAISAATALDRRRRQQQEADFVEWTQLLGSVLRAGKPVAAAIVSAVDEAPGLAPDGAHRATAAIERGRGLRPSLDEWRDRAWSPGERLLVVALLVALDRGTDATPAIDSVVQSMSDAALLRSKQRVLTAQARASAAVLVALPVGFGLFSSVARGELIYRGSTGLAIVGIGLLFDLAGFAWMRRLRRRLL